jgi:hypothetical protein
MKARTSRCWWAQRWFKLFPHDGLRSAAERHFIAFYNPSLNISNRALAHRVTSLH